MEHIQLATLEAGLAEIRQSPRDRGRVELVVRRPAEGEREVLDEAELNVVDGLVGDRWSTLGSPGSEDGSPHRDTQVTLMNARVAALVAGQPDRRQLAGDQLFVDLDLSAENLPPGTRLTVGSAILEVTAEPHLGCGKFIARFGVDAQRFVNSKLGRELKLRGINAKVITGGVVRPGDEISRLMPQPPENPSRLLSSSVRRGVEQSGSSSGS